MSQRWNTLLVMLLIGLLGLGIPAVAQDEPADADADAADAPADQVEADDAAEAPPAALTAEVLAVDGVAQWRPTPEADWRDIEVAAELPVGAEIQTGLPGSVQLQLGPTAQVTVERLTTITIARLQQQGQVVRTSLGMPHGKFNFNVKQAGFTSDFQVSTPDGTMAVKGTSGTVETGFETYLTGVPDNGVDSVVYVDRDGNRHAMTGKQQFIGNQVNDGLPPTNTGPGNDNNREDDNLGDGNGNGASEDLPNTEGLQNSRFSGTRDEFIDDNFVDPNSGGDG